MFKGLLLLIALAISPNLLADGNQADSSDGYNKIEVDSWFFKLGVGAVDIAYSGELQQVLDDLENQNGVSRMALAVDMGVYWTINNNYMAGFNANAHRDSFTNEISNTLLAVQVNNYALSNIYFFNQIEDGFFIRGDIGITKAVMQSDYYYDTTSKSGFGLAAGGGYCFNFTSVSVQAEVLLTNYTVEGDTINSSQFLVSLLF